MTWQQCPSVCPKRGGAFGVRRNDQLAAPITLDARFANRDVGESQVVEHRGCETHRLGNGQLEGPGEEAGGRAHIAQSIPVRWKLLFGGKGPEERDVVQVCDRDLEARDRSAIPAKLSWMGQRSFLGLMS